MANPELKKYLDKVSRIFSVDELLKQDINNQDVIDYYTQSDYGYRVFHSTEGSIHMALNFDGEFDKEGYYGQAKIVQEQIDEIHPSRVLELASGKGFNTIYLASRNKHIKFVGIDITATHVAIAKNKAHNIPNLEFQIGDFQNLGFPEETFDLIFVVESICHAMDMARALSEAYRVLKPSGRLIVFDGFRKTGFSKSDKDLQLAARMVEVSMAVKQAWMIDDWLKIAQDVGFYTVKVDDISQAIMPNLRKFQHLARGYFKFPALSNVLLHTLPPYLVKNAIAGLLMPFTVEAETQGYYLIILNRP